MIIGGEEQPPASRTSPCGLGDPVEAATQWLQDVLIRRDIRAAWRRGTDPDYRLALIQTIVFLNDSHPLLSSRDRDELAQQLSGEEPSHPLWPSFANLLEEEFLQALGEINLETLGAAAPTPARSGYQLVLFTDHEEQSAIQPAELHSYGVLMHLRGDRWLVAGLSGRPAVPGWPPDLGY